MRTYEVKAQLVYETTVIVVAQDEDSAKAEFNAGRWDEDGRGELVHWERVGKPKEVEGLNATE